MAGGMDRNRMKTKGSIVERALYSGALMLGGLAVAWASWLFIRNNALAFTITAVIGGVFAVGVVELLKFERATSTLCSALNAIQDKVDDFTDWLDRLDPSLRNAVRMRVEGERVGLPAPVLTPYLVGLLVMIGLLGTFVGMVETLRGAVTALEGTTELQAIRQGLAAPINGLGMAFGTSVAGVATSAMLGLMSTLSRRRRMLETRHLDTCIPAYFQDFSLIHRQRETFQALQQQGQSLPMVAGMLEGVANKLDHLGSALMDHQERFNQSVADRFAQFTDSINHALKENLAENVRLVGDTIKPIVKETLDGMAQQVQTVHHHLTQISQGALDEFAQKAALQASDQAHAWKDMLALYQQTHDSLIVRMGTTMDDVAKQYEHTTDSMQASFQTFASTWIEQQEACDRDRMARWRGFMDALQEQAATRLGDISTAMAAELKQVAERHQSAYDVAARNFMDMWSSLAATRQANEEETIARQKDLATLLTQTVDGLAERTQEMGARMQTEMTRLVESSADLIQSRRNMEAAWIESHARRMDAFMDVLTAQLTTLREDEHRWGQAATLRLEQLETVLTAHLSTLGQALEAPITRMIETASQAPRAAASLMERMHKETAKQFHRENRLLDERRRMMERLDTLSTSLDKNLSAQQSAIEQLIVSSKGMLETVGGQFAEQVNQKIANLSTAADTVTVSAVEMASLGEAFGTAVDLFNAANTDLIQSLSRIETALAKTTARSDDQLGYFVAQAREIIEQSMLSQKEIFEELRQLRPQKYMTLEAN